MYVPQNQCSVLFRSQLFSISSFLASAVNITMETFLHTQTVSLQCCAETKDAGCSELISRISVIVLSLLAGPATSKRGSHLPMGLKCGDSFLRQPLCSLHGTHRLVC